MFNKRRNWEIARGRCAFLCNRELWGECNGWLLYAKMLDDQVRPLTVACELRSGYYNASQTFERPHDDVLKYKDTQYWQKINMTAEPQFI